MHRPVSWKLCVVRIVFFMIAFAGGVILHHGQPLQAADDLDHLRVLPSREAQNRSPSALYQKLHEWAEQSMDRRTADYEKVKTPEQVAAWQQQRREVFLRALGELPTRSPLNAQVVGQLSGDGFRIEKVIFDSRPNHHVTANLYLPVTKPPYPGVIVPCGHSYTGKAADGYQRVSMLLAKNGIAALCYDPIGQGERYQTFGPDGKPLGDDYVGGASSVKQLADIPGDPHFNSVEEHTLTGLGAILVGTNAAQYRIHDGMRAIDYLVSRPEIDPQRIGCTGNSGGGTLTAYLMALDDRIRCAAPTCYLTTFRRLLATSGPQDAEQNLFGQLRDGLDEADYVLLRAPKPTVLCAGTRDATFDVTGTWDILREAKRIYSRLGFPERVDMVEADEPHGFTQPLRVGAVRWMRRWLLGVDDAISEPELAVFSPAELQCTPHGQVMQLPNEVSVFQLNQQRATLLAAQRRHVWKEGSREVALQQVRQLAGIRPLRDIPLATVNVIRSRTSAASDATPDGATFRMDALTLKTDSGLVLPALAFVPKQPSGRRILYLHSAGKVTDARPNGPIERLAKEGAVVLTVDLSGLGETAQKHPRDWGGSLFRSNTQEFFVAYLLGRSLVGLRAEEILVAARALMQYDAPAAGKKPDSVELVAIGSDAGIPAAHAAALEPQLFGKVIVRESLSSWLDVLSHPTAGEQLTNTVHAALTTYDLPDLLASLPGEKVVVERPLSFTKR